MSEWQDISTAPKDGTPVLLVDSIGHREVSDWNYSHVHARNKSWCVGPCRGEYNSRTEFYGPLFWQPLPEPPKP